MLRRGGAGEELTMRKGAHACAVELGGGDGMDSGSVNKGRVMWAVYSGCAGIRSGHGNGESSGLGSVSEGRETETGSKLRTCYTYGLLLTRTRSAYRLITILAVYENSPGLSRDNPLCLPFYFTSFSDCFSEVLDSCTVQRYQMIDGSASEALQTRVQYRRYQWLMGALLKRSRPMNSTWRCTPFYVQYRRRSPYCVLYIARHIGHSSI